MTDFTALENVMMPLIKDENKKIVLKKKAKKF